MRYRLCALLLLCLCLAPLAVHADAVVKIMPLGDSITRGGPDADTPFASYRYYLDDSLRASGHGADFVGSLSSSYTKFVFDQNHEGHGGYTTGMMVGTSSFSPLAAWLAASPTPDIVLLHVGTNDALNGVPVATRLANVRSIIGLLRQKNPKVRVMVAQIIPTGNATLNRNSGLVDYNSALPSLAAGISTAASPVTVVDLSAGYAGVADNQPDGIHPKATGERKMATAWQRALAPVLAAATPTRTTTTAVPTTKPTTAATAPTTNAVPGTLEAENYNTGGEGVAYHDATAANQGGAYRTDGVDIEATGGGYAVGYVRDGEWLKYTISAASAGKYSAAFRVAAWGTNAHAIEVSVNDNPAATVAVPTTGSYDAWTTATAALTLPAGTCTLKVRFVGDGQNLDRVVLTPVAVATTPTTAVPISTGRKVPGTVEAEDYNAGGEGVGYHDTTAGNHDGVYRHDDVDLSVNPSGGYNVGYVVDGEWLAYTLAVPSAGTYTVSCTVASWADGRSLALALDGASLGTLAVPNNCGIGWQTVSTRVALPAGDHRFKVRFVGDKQILDRVAVAAVTTPTTTVPVTVPPTSKANAVPGTVEAEDYVPGGEGAAYHDTTAGNLGGVYRADSVDIETLSGGGYAVGYVRDGEWLRYSVPVAAAGRYQAAFRVAAWGANAHAIEVSVNDNPAATVTVPTTGSYDAWTAATTSFLLPAGTASLKLRFVGDGQNLDRIVFTPVAVTTPPTTIPTTAPAAGRPVPGTLEAEDYDTGGEGVGYHDATASNQGGACRADGVDIESLPGGGYAVGYVRDGEWLKYTVGVANAGRYQAAFRVAAWGTNAHAIEVSVNDNPAATVAVPTTGSYDAWTTATAALTLPAGSCTLKVRFVGDGQNLDKVVLTPVAVTTTPTTAAPTMPGRTVPGTLEAENYITGGEGVAYHDATAENQGGAYRTDGVDIEATGGGYAVGYVRDGEWLKYTVSAASAGKYTAAFRVAAWGANAHAIEVSVNDNPAATVAVPTTGSYDAWTTATAALTLPAGTASLKLRFVGDGQNLDRVAFSTVATPTTAIPTTVQTTLGGIIRLPAEIQAENYATGGEGVGYHDTTGGNQGGAYRSDGVDIAYAPSIGSYVVTRIQPGEWLEYRVDAPEERDYTLMFRLSSPNGGQYFEMMVDGRSEVAVTAPRTGSYDAYAAISTQVRLTKGVHRIRIRFDGDGQNLDAFGLA
ncbi:MAG: carbohydrate-binding protein [Methanospirillum sp.]